MDWRFSIFLLSLFGLLVGIPWLTSDAGLCGIAMVQKATSGSEATTCFEFWLNRYQTLLAALVAAVAAGAAWVAVQKQVEVSTKQIAIGLGDLEPDFYMYGGIMEDDRNHSNVVIEITNNNRLDITLNQIMIISPVDFDVEYIMYSINNSHRSLQFWKTGNICTFELRVVGTRPSAPEASRIKLTLKSRNVANPFVGERLHFAQMKVKLVYQLRKQPIQDTATELEGGIAFRTFEPATLTARGIVQD